MYRHVDEKDTVNEEIQKVNEKALVQQSSQWWTDKGTACRFSFCFMREGGYCVPCATPCPHPPPTSPPFTLSRLCSHHNKKPEQMALRFGVVCRWQTAFQRIAFCGISWPAPHSARCLDPSSSPASIHTEAAAVGRWRLSESGWQDAERRDIYVHHAA